MLIQVDMITNGIKSIYKAAHISVAFEEYALSSQDEVDVNGAGSALELLVLGTQELVSLVHCLEYLSTVRILVRVVSRR